MFLVLRRAGGWGGGGGEGGLETYFLDETMSLFNVSWLK